MQLEEITPESGAAERAYKESAPAYHEGSSSTVFPYIRRSSNDALSVIAYRFAPGEENAVWTELLHSSRHVSFRLSNVALFAYVLAPILFSIGLSSEHDVLQMLLPSICALMIPASFGVFLRMCLLPGNMPQILRKHERAEAFFSLPLHSPQFTCAFRHWIWMNTAIFVVEVFSFIAGIFLDVLRTESEPLGRENREMLLSFFTVLLTAVSGVHLFAWSACGQRYWAAATAAVVAAYAYAVSWNASNVHGPTRLWTFLLICYASCAVALRLSLMMRRTLDRRYLEIQLKRLYG